jgi:hypothetical protein
MWREYYPDCDIHILDLFMDNNHVSTNWCRKNFFVPHRGSQSDINVLTAVKDQFEIIVDDGSHNAADQLISFKHIFLNNLLTKGVYAIEDCHCNKIPFYYSDFVKSFEDTALNMFTVFRETGKLINPYFQGTEIEMFQNLIDRVEILADEKLILIWRK